jgi:hypothetical protein
MGCGGALNVGTIWQNGLIIKGFKSPDKEKFTDYFLIPRLT